MGHALTLDLPEDVYQGLIQQAEQTGQPPEVVAVQLLVAAIQHRGDDPLEQFIGAFRGRAADWADQHDACLGKLPGAPWAPRHLKVIYSLVGKIES
jgi:hypothetical protein